MADIGAMSRVLIELKSIEAAIEDVQCRLELLGDTIEDSTNQAAEDLLGNLMIEKRQLMRKYRKRCNQATPLEVLEVLAEQIGVEAMDDLE